MLEFPQFIDFTIIKLGQGFLLVHQLMISATTMDVIPPASLILILVVVVQITIKDFAPSIYLGRTCSKFTEV